MVELILEENLLKCKKKLKPRNYIVLNLLRRRSSGSGIHEKTRKAERRKLKVDIEKLKKGDE